MGAAFLGTPVYDFAPPGLRLRDNAYASIFFVIIGLHALHVLVGLLISAVVQLKVWTRPDRRPTAT